MALEQTNIKTSLAIAPGRVSSISQCHGPGYEEAPRGVVVTQRAGLIAGMHLDKQTFLRCVAVDVARSRVMGAQGCQKPWLDGLILTLR